MFIEKFCTKQVASSLLMRGGQRILRLRKLLWKIIGIMNKCNCSYTDIIPNCNTKADTNRYGFINE